MTHGLSSTKEYYVWKTMKSRCNRKNDASYPNYGGRGITVCDEWKTSFETFLKDMGKCPEGLTLDRIDNNGNYNKENCSWVSRHNNNRNKRNNRIFTVNGITKVMQDWAIDNNLSAQTLKARLDLLGWPIEKALSKEIRKKTNRFCNAGHEYKEGSFIVSKHGQRRCKECQRIYDQKRRPAKVKQMLDDNKKDLSNAN